MQWFHVLNGDGTPHLSRLRIIQTPLGGVYLHAIHSKDDDRDPHDHPWTFWSMVLSGIYIDRVWDDPRDLKDSYTRVHRKRKIHRTRRSQAHQIVGLRGNVRTLVLVGPKGKSWRFWTPEGPVDWKDYDKRGEQSEPVR